MKRLVIDTNVIVSGIVGFSRAESRPGELLRLWSAQAFIWCMSSVIVDEVRRTLERPYFLARLSADERAAALTTIETKTDWIEPTKSVEGVASHPEDDSILATAVSARADALVTGDAQLLALGTYATIRITTVRDILEHLSTER